MKNYETLAQCKLCIRNCGINRLNGETGACNATDKLKIARAELHHWEEPCISGENGSGTVFFSNCNLKCVFCQNFKISQQGNGLEITPNRLTEIFLELQKKGAHNINLVTPTHYVPQIIVALKEAKALGLTIPIVYNTNTFDSIETIKALDGLIDVYLPDFKYFNDKYSIKYSKAPGYYKNAIEIITEMITQVGEPIFKDNLLQKGVIIRHLLLPGLLFDSKKIIDAVYSHFGDKVYVSLMNQYTPLYNSKDYPEINKRLNPKLYNSLIHYCLNLGMKNGFIQDEGTSCESYVPSFNNEGVIK